MRWDKDGSFVMGAGKAFSIKSSTCMYSHFPEIDVIPVSGFVILFVIMIKTIKLTGHDPGPRRVDMIIPASGVKKPEKSFFVYKTGLILPGCL